MIRKNNKSIVVNGNEFTSGEIKISNGFYVPRYVESGLL
jgi:hypothetical protein